MQKQKSNNNINIMEIFMLNEKSRGHSQPDEKPRNPQIIATPILNRNMGNVTNSELSYYET